MNCNIDDREIAIAALNCVNSSLKHHTIALDALTQANNPLTFDFLTSQPLQEEQRSEMHDGEKIKNMERSALRSVVSTMNDNRSGLRTSDCIQ